MKSLNFNVPNILTILRFFLSPLFFFFFIFDQVEIALIVFMFVAVTDFADGWIARSTNQTTKFGQALDPIADKFMIFLALLAVLIKFDFPLWAVPLFILRDIVSICGSIIVYTKKMGIWKANNFGKITTFFQIATIISYIISLAYKEIILSATIVLGFIAAATYSYRQVKILKGKTKDI